MTTPFGLLPSGPVPDPKLEHATDHKERAIGVLLSQLRDKPRFTKLIEILVRPLQEIEDVIWDLYTKRRLDSAAGVQLDVIGRIVDEQRAGLNDDDYRAILRIKIRVLFSRGTGPDLIKICQLFLQSNDFTYTEFYPAAIAIDVAGATTRPSLLSRFLKRAKSGGVRLDVFNGTGPMRFTSVTTGGGSGSFTSVVSGGGSGSFAGVY
jgi:Protein of unknown function (DUF2612)